ncbi:hypothetical protein [Spiroplasma endosymbiont of Nebria brevicollis]|uniref:hypothetical protein n=1 Tax=Spiroplasma endosymbiont of Nebria brevicollis TaxID=3066284 RepID=UPI00313B8F93
MAPEFPNLKVATHESFVPYLKSLKDYYNFINPQFYNQLGDGVSQTSDDKDYFLNTNMELIQVDDCLKLNLTRN